MKYKTLLVIFIYCSLIFSANSQTTNDHDFCQKFPLNSRCQDNSIDKKTNSDERLNSDENNIVDNLTINDVESYLRELGYVDLKKDEKNNSISFLMQGRLSTVLIAPNGKGMALASYYSKTEKTTLEAINDWNQGVRYSFAFLFTTRQNTELVMLETNLTVTGGVTEERIKSFFTLHTYYQAAFSQYLNEL